MKATPHRRLSSCDLHGKMVDGGPYTYSPNEIITQTHTHNWVKFIWMYKWVLAKWNKKKNGHKRNCCV